jgi:ankyrin repeat protein
MPPPPPPRYIEYFQVMLFVHNNNNNQHLIKIIITKDEETPLILATRERHTELVKLLLARGSDVNAANKVFLRGDTLCLFISCAPLVSFLAIHTLYCKKPYQTYL